MGKVLKGLGRARIKSSEGNVGKERLFLSRIGKSKNSRYGTVEFSRRDVGSCRDFDQKEEMRPIWRLTRMVQSWGWRWGKQEKIWGNFISFSYLLCKMWHDINKEQTTRLLVTLKLQLRRERWYDLLGRSEESGHLDRYLSALWKLKWGEQRIGIIEGKR